MKLCISANFAVQNTNLDAKASGARATYIDSFFTSEGYSNAATSADFMEYKVGVLYSYNTLNKAFLPTAGIRHRLSLDLSVPGSDLEYYTASYLGETYIPVFDQEDVSLKFKTRVGYGDGLGDSDGLPFLKNFFAGGIRTVRGYAYNSLGPVDNNSEQVGGNVLMTATSGITVSTGHQRNRPSPFVNIQRCRSSLCRQRKARGFTLFSGSGGRVDDTSRTIIFYLRGSFE